MIFQTSSFGTCKVRKLQKDERVKSFNCGDDDLNDFILNESPHYQKALKKFHFPLDSSLRSQLIFAVASKTSYDYEL